MGDVRQRVYCMKVWTIVNQKGGVGKTTTAVSLAGSLCSMGYKVALIDLDPHASLTHYLKFDSDELGLSIYDLCIAANNPALLNKLLPKAILSTSTPNLDLIGSHMALATLDGAITQQTGQGLLLKKILACMAQKPSDETATDARQSKPYDFVIVDCQPVLGILMINALMAANLIVLPTQTEHLGLHGLNRMLSTIEQMSSNLMPNYFSLIVPTMFDRRLKACVDAYSNLRDIYKGKVWRGYIPVDTKFRESSVQGFPINKVAPSSKGSFAYEKLTMELLKHG